MPSCLRHNRIGISLPLLAAWLPGLHRRIQKIQTSGKLYETICARQNLTEAVGGPSPAFPARFMRRSFRGGVARLAGSAALVILAPLKPSEERRVGKECR